MRRRPWKRKRVKLGRPRLVSLKLQTEALALKERGIAMPEIARRLNLGVSTIYRLLAEQKDERGREGREEPRARHPQIFSDSVAKDCGEVEARCPA
jgi:predicted DNA-binding transcriptional regulator AlpA